MSQQRYGLYETGKSEPNVSTWLLLADHLNVTVDFIMRGNKPAAASKPSKVA